MSKERKVIEAAFEWKRLRDEHVEKIRSGKYDPIPDSLPVGHALDVLYKALEELENG